MRIALTAEGTRGDIYPMLTLASACGVKGHDVVVCAPPDFRDATTERGLKFRPVGQDIRAYLTAEAAALHAGPLAIAKTADKLFQSNVANQFGDLVSATEGCDLILAAGTQIAASSAAERLGVPYRFIAYDPILLPSAEHPSILFCTYRMPRWANRVTWWLQRKLFSLAMGKQVNEQRARLGLAPVQDLYRLALGHDPVLATEPRLAPAPPEWSETRSVGCLHPFLDGTLPEKLQAFLDSGEPPIYVGFGSMTDPNPEATTSLVIAAAREAGVRLVLGAGWAGLGGGPLPSDVFVAGPVDHAALFRRVSLVIHHGGAGTTTTAARAGKPQVVVPHVMDQFHWSHRMEMLGVAPPSVPRRRLTQAALVDAIRGATQNEWLVDRAAELGEKLRDDRKDRPNPADVLV